MGRAAKNPLTGVTAQQEEFCYQCFRLGDPVRAYRAAYNAENMQRDTIRERARELLNSGAIAGRLEHYRQIAERKLEVSVARIAAELARIGFADPGDLCDDDGKFIALHMLPENVRRAVRSVEIVEKQTGKMKVGGEEGLEFVPERVKKIHLHDKHSALLTMAKWKRMIVERVEHGAAGEFDSKTIEQLEREVAEEEKELALIQKAAKRRALPAPKATRARAAA